jgi:hypothetical protein
MPQEKKPITIGSQLIQPMSLRKGSAKNLNFVKIPNWAKCRKFEAQIVSKNHDRLVGHRA